MHGLVDPEIHTKISEYNVAFRKGVYYNRALKDKKGKDNFNGKREKVFVSGSFSNGRTH